MAHNLTEFAAVSTEGSSFSRLVKWQDRLTIANVLYFLLCILLVAGLAHRFLNRPHRSVTTEKFEDIAEGLQIFDNTYGRLPYVVKDGDEGQSSWRYGLLPFVFRGAATFNTNKSWKSPAIRADWEYWSPVYCYQDTDNSTQTMVLAVTGPNTAFGDGQAPPCSIRDLDSDTIILVECRQSGCEWPEPGDADIESLRRFYSTSDARGLSSNEGAGFHVAFADGAVWFVSNKVPFERLERFMTVQGAYDNERRQLLGAYRK